MTDGEKTSLACSLSDVARETNSIHARLPVEVTTNHLTLALPTLCLSAFLGAGWRRKSTREERLLADGIDIEEFPAVVRQTTDPGEHARNAHHCRTPAARARPPA